MNNLSKQLLYNKYVLIFIFILAIGNIIQFVSQGDYFSTAILILVGFLTSFFSKNMVVIMIVGMVVANILKYGTKITSPWKEGFDNHDEKDDSEKEEEDSSKKEKGDADDKEEEEEEFTTEKESNKKASKKEKQKLIESDALDDLRAEMKIGFKRLNQNIDSIQTMGFFN
jgi:hypothetical protein